MDESDVSRSGRDLTGVLLDNRYRVEMKLGEGGMAQVYLASDERLGRPVVVKVPLEVFLTVSGFRERFAHEILALIQLDHPFIGKILDRGEMSGIPFAVLQYLPGGSLMARIEEAGGRLTPEQIATWLPRVASALDFIHARNFLHRDIKPANILFDSEQNVYVADFGIAKVLGDKEFTNLTQTGTLPGTVAYMAPEAGEHRTPGPAYDQYALAVVVYQALSGDLPHEMGESPISALVQKIISDPVPLAEVCPDLPEGVCAAVMKALNASPEERFESCKAFAEAFKDGMATATGVAGAAAATATGDPPTGRAPDREALPTQPLPSPEEPNTIVLPDRPPPIMPGNSPVVLPDEGMRYDPLESISREKRRLPAVSLPKLNFARIADSLPKISFPRLKLPRLSMRALRRPKSSLPKSSLPKFSLPKLSLPTFSLPRLSLPKFSLPKLSLPKLGLPKFSLPLPAREGDGKRRLLVGAVAVTAVAALVAGYLMFPSGSRTPAEPPAARGDDATAANPTPGTLAGGLMPGEPPSAEVAATQAEDSPGGRTEAQTAPSEGTAEPPATAQGAAPAGNDEPAVAAEPEEHRNESPPAAGADQGGEAARVEEPAAPVGETRAPHRISAATPEYPELPFALAIEGDVVVEATIGVDGSVTGATVTQSLHPLLDLAALEAVRRWTYEPALRNGEAREYPMSARLTFALPPTPDPGPVRDAGIESARQLDTTRFLTRLAAALEEFRRQNNAYPQALEQLQPLMGVVPTLDSWDTRLWYRALDNEYWLISFGRDGVPGPPPPQPWRVGEAFESDLRVHAGNLEQVPQDAAAIDPAAPTGGEPATPETVAIADIETVPITEDVTPPVLVPASVAFLLDRTVQDQIGLTTRRVSVYCLVTAEGRVAEARVLQVDPAIPIAAMATAFADSARRSAIDTWRFQPASKNGTPVAVWRLVHVSYQPVR